MLIYYNNKYIFFVSNIIFNLVLNISMWYLVLGRPYRHLILTCIYVLIKSTEWLKWVGTHIKF